MLLGKLFKLCNDWLKLLQLIYKYSNVSGKLISDWLKFLQFIINFFRLLGKKSIGILHL